MEDDAAWGEEVDEAARVAAWAAEVLRHADRTWTRLERVGETLRLDRLVGRPVRAVRLRVWSPGGVALVRLGGTGSVEARLAPGDDGAEAPGEPLAKDDPALARATEAAVEAAARAGPELAWGARETSGRRRRGVVHVRVALERAAADDLLTLTSDATTGARLGLDFPRLLRGSRRSGALGRGAAVGRARAWLGLLGVAADADGSRLVRARLAPTGEARTWRLSFATRDADGGERRIAVVVNARTGAVAALRVALRRRDLVDPRACAEADLRLAVSARLGPFARSGPLVGGNRLGGRPVWLAVVHAPGGVWRATIDRGRVTFVRVRAG